MSKNSSPWFDSVSLSPAQHWAFLRLDPGTSDNMSLGTFCSGTDCAVQVFQSFLAACAASFEIPVADMPRFQHLFSCEKDQKKGEFLRRFCNMGRLHPDALEPVGEHAAVVSAGFPCDDASALLPHSSSDKHRTCVAEERVEIEHFMIHWGIGIDYVVLLLFIRINTVHVLCYVMLRCAVSKCTCLFSARYKDYQLHV